MEVFSYEYDSQKQNCTNPKKQFSTLILGLKLDYAELKKLCTHT